MLRHYESLKSLFEETFPRIDKYTRAHRRVIKYIIAGGTSAWTDIALLFAFTHFLGIHYIYSSIIAWIIAFWISFFLQKFWTFGKRTLKGAHRELIIYFSVALINLAINTYALYVFVEFLHINYLISQIIIGLATAVVTYSINKFFIFKHIHPAGKYVIVIATPSYPPDAGGPSTHAEKYVQEFTRVGHEVRLVIFSKLLRLPAGLRHLVFAFFVARQSIGANIIYVMDPVSSGVAAYVARLLRKPYIIRVGGDIVWERGAEKGLISKSCITFYETEKYSNFRFYNITKSVLQHAKKVIVPSQLLAKVCEKYYSIPAKKIILIPNPLPTKISPIQYSERSVIFASRLVEYKNLGFVIKAFSDIDATLYILGSGPQEIKIAIGNVKAVGTVSREKKDEYLKKCMLTIAPALTEFNPNYVLEGFAFGKPTLMSRENGMPFALPENMLFNPRNEREFIEKLNFLLSENGYKQAQNWVKELSYSQTWENVIQKNLEIISEVCGS
ncbi:MAG: GtrA family protein [Candidatus Paceibacterota bacterium]|jgi:glycosyltransferase involved in cell wall biosynthesis/putative flippase GtrA